MMNSDPSGLVILDDGQHRITIHANDNYITLTDQRGEDVQQVTFVPGEMDRIATWWRLFRALRATKGGDAA
jgi:hypothetical protein